LGYEKKFAPSEWKAMPASAQQPLASARSQHLKQIEFSPTFARQRDHTALEAKAMWAATTVFVAITAAAKVGWLPLWAGVAGGLGIGAVTLAYLAGWALDNIAPY
jgi:hypothetical protein